MIKKLFISLGSLLLMLLFADLFDANAAGNTIQIAVNKANIRSEPIDSANVIGQANRNDQFQVLQEKFGWYQVQLPNGKKGWVAGYIVSQNSSGGPSKSGTITTDQVHVRNSPSLSAAIIGKIHTGEQVTITAEQNGWTNIQYKGQDAWVNKQYVQYGGETSPTGSTPANGFAFISTDKTNLRAHADISSPVITKGSPGERYPIVGQEGDWYKITLASGREAYVASWVVSSGENSGPTAKPTGTTGGIAGKTIVLDAGHGGYDPGTTGIAGIAEKQLTMQTVHQLRQKLSNAGANVVLTRANDRYVPLSSRAATADSYDADAFISIHYDSAALAEANGVTTYYHHGYQQALANSVNKELGNSLSLRNRGTRYGDYQVIRNNNKPAALLELGYLSNPHEGTLVTTDSYQERVSSSIFNGLQSYFNK